MLVRSPECQTIVSIVYVLTWLLPAISNISAMVSIVHVLTRLLTLSPLCLLLAIVCLINIF